MVLGPTNRQDPARNPAHANADADAAGPQAPARPPAPGGGALTNPLFSGDHVLESVANGTGVLKHGARGPAVRAIQTFLISQGLDLGRSGADGAWGAKTSSAVKAWQASHGLGNDGIVGKQTVTAMDKAGNTPVAPSTTAAPSTTTTPAGTQGGGPGSQLPTDFEKVWAAHPHNYQADWSQNTDSSDLQVQQGWDPDQYSNTCAIRMSVMFNKLGGKYSLTREKAKAAGIDPRRLPYSRKTGWYYILSAKELWTYVSHWGGQAHVEFPARGRYKSAGEFERDFDDKIRPVVEGKQGLVAFDKIFGYSGTGHVDVFNGMNLSDANEWYPS